ncbi:MAG: Gfo/Idh/MocA family protein [Granulosicoccus sp.]
MKKRIAVVGAGLIGRRHAEAILNTRSASLGALVDPDPHTAVLAAQYNTVCLESLDSLLDAKIADGIVLSTPNQQHVPQALACIEAKIPVLVEKPLAIDLSGAISIVRASDAASVPVLTGHHRRHNPLVVKARQMISEGQLGTITAAQATTWFYKPDEYFDVPWRTRPGAGPVYINLIHDVDMLRHLCGEVIQVQAMESRMVRENEVEDTCVILMRFADGALGTLSVSDCTASPWSWELTARENPAYPVTSELCYQIGGTHGSLALPDLSLWQHPQKRSWWEPISARRVPFAVADPLVRQIDQFVSVICGEQSPLVSARDGMLNQQVIEAIKRSASERRLVDISMDPEDPSSV